MGDPVIEFACFYCGRPMQAADDLLHQQVPCPDCGHAIVVSRRKLGVHASDQHRAQKRPDASFWEGKTDQEIIASLLTKRITEKEQQPWAVKLALLSFAPRYDDLTLFALSLSFLLLGFLSEDLRRDLLALSLAVSVGPGPLGVLLVAVLGLGLSLIGVFWQREKSVPEKAAMLLFAVVITTGTGLYASWIVLRTCRGWLMIFPLWNMIHAGLLLVLFRLGVADSDCVVDEHAGFAQVVLTAVCIPILLGVCQYFELPWAITFSITVAYVMSLHNALRDTFGGRRPTSRDARC